MFKKNYVRRVREISFSSRICNLRIKYFKLLNCSCNKAYSEKAYSEKA